MKVQLALYKGPATDLGHKVAHWAIRWFQRSQYSHAELVLGGTCYSASPRDGGVRSKKIDLTTGKWDVVDLPGVPNTLGLLALADQLVHTGAKYDWLGVARYVFPFLPESKARWFCYEFVSTLLGLADNDERHSAESLRDAALARYGGS